MASLKTVVQQVKVNDKVNQFFGITSYDAVGKEFNSNGTVKKSLRDDLEAFALALLEKANSDAVTEEIQQACENLYNRITGNVGNNTIDEAYDTLKEVADWIGTHGEAAATLTSEISTLKTTVQNLAQQIQNVRGTTVEASETNGNIKVDDVEVPVYRNPGKNVFVASTAAEATAAEAKMQNGDMLFQIVPENIELKDASVEAKTAHNFIGDLDNLISTNKLTEKKSSFSKLTIGGNAAKSNIPNYKYGSQYFGSASVLNNIFYTDGHIMGGVATRANLSTGELLIGNDMVTFEDIVLPKGYYKVKNITESSEFIFNIIIATFNSSGTVTRVTNDTFNQNNEMVEYLGESYLITE